MLRDQTLRKPVPGRPGGRRAGPAGRGRERVRNALDRFAIDFSLCMYCGICIEVCPYDALFWSPEFSYAEPDLRDLTHERGRLRTWMQTVPPPPAHDPGAPPPRELLAADGAARQVPGAPGAARHRPAGGAQEPARAPGDVSGS